MRNAETVLNIIQDRGKRSLPLEDVYRQLYNPALYLRAYANIHQNKGALTKGIDGETVDGMSHKRITDMIDELRHERYRWMPVKRVYIPKKNGKTRPLGLPGWKDKLLQEVIRQILEAYYEPQFSDLSHGFRPQRGCHSALNSIHKNWTGTKWFIEGDIKGCFDNINHDILLNMLRAQINDNRFIRLIANMLKAGYCEQWKYYPTLSGTPQGGIASPILSNIYLTALDKYVEYTLIPEYTRGTKRRKHPEYTRIKSRAQYYKGIGRTDKWNELRKEYQAYPSVDTHDSHYRRLLYVRYADDYLFGFAGPKAEALEIKERIRRFLQEELNLEQAEEKTLITHAVNQRARFLGYEVGIARNQTKMDRTKRRIVSGKVVFYIPTRVIDDKVKTFLRRGKPIHRAELIRDSEFDIIYRYQWEYRGLVEYYAMAQNLTSLGKLRYVMEVSLLKTLANKGRTTVAKTYKRLASTKQTPHGPRACLKLVITREGKKPLVAEFGGISLVRRRTANIKENSIMPYIHARSEVVDRLLNDTCEVCGATGNVEVHHIRKLSDLRKPGRKEKPLWMRIMSARYRKTLVVCRTCHMNIQWNR